MKQHPTLLILFLLFAFTQSYAQENSVSAAKWNRLESDDKAFSIAFPPSAIVDAEDRKYSQKLRIIGFQNGVEMELTVVKDPNVRERPRNIRPNDLNQLSSMTVGEFSVLQIRPGGTAAGKKFVSSFWIIKKDMLYLVKINAKTGQEAEAARFLFSINLQGNPLFVQKDKKDKADFPEEIVPMANLKTSAEVEEAFDRKFEKGKINVAYEASSNELNEVEYDGLTRKVVIVDRPFPILSMGYGAPPNGMFSVRLKINFRANGQIGDITVLSIENKEFSKACIEAARKIRFIPAQINGKNADTVDIVEYTAQIFSVPGVMVRP